MYIDVVKPVKSVVISVERARKDKVPVLELKRCANWHLDKARALDKTGKDFEIARHKAIAAELFAVVEAL